MVKDKIESTTATKEPMVSERNKAIDEAIELVSDLLETVQTVASGLGPVRRYTYREDIAKALEQLKE